MNKRESSKLAEMRRLEMTEETKVESLVLEHLRHIRAAVDRIDSTVTELRGRVGHLQEQYASISRRVDRIDERLDRVEKRLELSNV